jgi:hypothetical protein
MPLPGRPNPTDPGEAADLSYSAGYCRNLEGAHRGRAELNVPLIG